MKILITGNMGYVGSVLGQFLTKEIPRVELIGYDTAFFGHLLTGADVYPESLLSIQHIRDIRDINIDVLNGVDAIVHLAAISNDPMGKEFELVTKQINQEATINLVNIASQAGVKNFVFASSCSIYGHADAGEKKESDPLNPLTAYARSKVGVEDGVKNLNIGNMIFTSLRFATACGWSNRMRLDLVLNDFVACAISSKKITVLSDGSPWRPLIDVEDMCRAIAWGIIRTSTNGGQFLIVNAGSNDNNYQVSEIARAVADNVPGTIISINSLAPPDKRSYLVDFSLYKKIAPKHQPKVSLQESIRKIQEGLLSIKFDDIKFRESNYIRLNTLRNHISNGRVGKNLHWSFKK